MSGCHNPYIEIKACEHHIPINYGCAKCDMTVLKERIENIEKQLRALEDHKNRQIDENRKISVRVDELQESGFEDMKNELICFKKQRNEINERINAFQEQISLLIKIRLDDKKLEKCDHDERINDLENIQAEPRLIRLEEAIKISKKPHKCPVCEGTRYCLSKESGMTWPCGTCEGKGVLWG